MAVVLGVLVSQRSESDGLARCGGGRGKDGGTTGQLAPFAPAAAAALTPRR